MEIETYSDFKNEVTKEEHFFFDKLVLRRLTTRVSWLLLRKGE